MFNHIFEILAKVKFNEYVPVKDLLEIYINSALEKTNILIFTSNLDYELYSSIYKGCSAGFGISLVYTSPETITGVRNPEVENILTSLPEIGVSCYRLNIDDNTKEILERRV